ncbi:MAG: hypothetical protein PHP32_02950 [Candidatus Izemoplasmatales bacterium]|nr:hypothetical protein [Candidatus Izemoplasmatales bacterium]
MKDQHEIRFDMVAKAKKQAWYLRPVTWLIAFPTVWARKLKVHKHAMKGLKPPYILLCTHHAFVDFSVTTAAIFPHPANYIVAIDGFIGREKLLREVGGICKRKFTNDTVLVKQIKHSLHHNQHVCAIYPEARYSIAGTTAILPESLGKLCKMMKVPVVVLNMHGDYLSQPVWNLKKRKIRLEADITQIVTAEEILTLSFHEINQRIHQAFSYDEYQYLKESGQKILEPWRAEGLHRVLYQCPHCGSEKHMTSSGSELTCTHCGAVYEHTENGDLTCKTSESKFTSIPDWYEYEREQVKKQILDGTYHFEDEVWVDSLPNSKGYIRLGKSKLIHDLDGFHVRGDFDGEIFELEKDPLSTYSIHIEYDYLGKGHDCIDLSTLDDTYYLYPIHAENVVTKLHFAAEELYKIKWNEKRGT